jgi:hypothetical protein
MEVQPWATLLNFGKSILAAPTRAGKRHSLAKLIKRRIEGSDSEALETKVFPSNGSKFRSTDERLAASVSSKIEDGNVRAAARLLFSDDTPLEFDESTFADLCKKHPPASESFNLAGCDSTYEALQVTENEVVKAVLSFPAGSSGGPDGFRPQHLVELIKCPVSGSELLTALTSLVNCLLRGNCPDSVVAVLFGATLIALRKKSGGIRPIAIGYIWRRLASKCANTFAASRVADYLQPIQVGVGISGGCEAAVHAVRRFTQSMPTDHVIAKLDFTNAFNSLKRSRLLAAVQAKVPEILSYCLLAYGNPSHLRFGKKIVLSCEGVQQGDPLGPLFCLAIHPLLTTLTSKLRIGYLDDITLGGSKDSVCADITRIQAGGKDIGLELNASKCEAISQSDCSHLVPLNAFVQLSPQEANLLGAPLLIGPAMEAMLEGCRESLERSASKLKIISSHDALIILKFSLGAPKLTFTLRSSPCAGHPLLQSYDSSLRRALSAVVNVDLTDDQWSQASLPIRLGGLGIRSVSLLAPSAYLASAAGTRELQNNILSRCGLKTDDLEVERTLAIWGSLSSQTPPEGNSARLQKSWDSCVCKAAFDSLLDRQIADCEKARLLAVSSNHSSDWLHALPLSSCGLRLDNEAVRVSVGLRLGANLCEPHSCPCGATVDARGLHGLVCKRSAGRISRHQLLNDIVWRALNKAGIPSIKEPQGLARTDNKRPDGVTQIPWEAGKCVTWDVTVTDTLAASNLHFTASIAGAAAEKAAERKSQKYAFLSNTYTFVPIACETLGPLNMSGADFITAIGRRISSLSGDRRDCSYLWQRLSMAVQRFNSICLLGTFETIQES